MAKAQAQGQGQGQGQLLSRKTLRQQLADCDAIADTAGELVVEDGE